MKLVGEVSKQIENESIEEEVVNAPFEAVTIQYQVPGANWAVMLKVFPEMVDVVTPDDKAEF